MTFCRSACFSPAFTFDPPRFHVKVLAEGYSLYCCRLLTCHPQAFTPMMHSCPIGKQGRGGDPSPYSCPALLSPPQLCHRPQALQQSNDALLNQRGGGSWGYMCRGKPAALRPSPAALCILLLATHAGILCIMVDLPRVGVDCMFAELLQVRQCAGD